MLQKRLSRNIQHANRAVARCLESLVVRSVLLRRLRHETHIGHAAHRLRIEGAMPFAELNDLMIDRRVTAVGDDQLGILQLAFRIPHLPRVANDRRYGSIDNDVAGHVQIGNPFVRIHHRHGRPLLVDL